jgi:hypothetical protein
MVNGNKVGDYKRDPDRLAWGTSFPKSEGPCAESESIMSKIR